MSCLNFAVCLFILGSVQSAILDANNVHYLEHAETFKHEAAHKEDLQIFCYRGKSKNVIHIWQSVVLHINHSADDYSEYDGYSADDVKKKYRDHSESWSFNLFSSKNKIKKLDPFNSSCFGLLSYREYSVSLNEIKIDIWKILLLALGVFLFVSAENISKNTVFHYLSGIVFGITASFLILIYIFSKLFPKKPFMYGFIGCGWTIVLYFLNLLWDNVQNIIANYSSYVIWYIIITGFISFIFCYRWGPVTNKRTINLIKWSLQFLALVAIFYSSHYKEAAMGQIVILLVSYNFPKKWADAPKNYWKKKFPPKVNLLTNDQYYEQGVKETAKALEELRKYCSSPECSQWKMALKIKDVKRFASFIEGNSHLSDEEILEYEMSVNGDVTDDENEEVSYSEDEPGTSF